MVQNITCTPHPSQGGAGWRWDFGPRSHRWRAPRDSLFTRDDQAAETERLGLGGPPTLSKPQKLEPRVLHLPKPREPVGLYLRPPLPTRALP